MRIVGISETVREGQLAGDDAPEGTDGRLLTTGRVEAFRLKWFVFEFTQLSSCELKGSPELSVRITRIHANEHTEALFGFGYKARSTSQVSKRPHSYWLHVTNKEAIFLSSYFDLTPA